MIIVIINIIMIINMVFIIFLMTSDDDHAWSKTTIIIIIMIAKNTIKVLYEQPNPMALFVRSEALYNMCEVTEITIEFYSVLSQSLYHHHDLPYFVAEFYHKASLIIITICCYQKATVNF